VKVADLIRPRALAGWLAAVALALGIPLVVRAQANSGYLVLQNNCRGCHSLEVADPETKKRTRAEWAKILDRMVNQRGASLNKRERALLLDYFDSFNYLPAAINWAPGPAKSHQLTLSPKDKSRVPAPMVAQTSGTGRTTPWVVAQDAKTKALFLAPSRPAKDGHYPLLLDNSGVVGNGRVSVKFQIAPGKGRLGAGLVVGYLGSSSYYGVRVSPTSNDVVLYRVTPDARSLLARTRLKVAISVEHTLSLKVTGGRSEVLFDGKPLPQLSRAIPGYRPGHVGFGTQGPTAARFTDWRVEVGG